MAWLGEELPEKDRNVPPRYAAVHERLVEEKLFEKKRDLFADLTLAFFDTTRIYFEGEVLTSDSEATPKTTVPISNRWWSALYSIVRHTVIARSYGRATRPM